MTSRPTDLDAPAALLQAAAFHLDAVTSARLAGRAEPGPAHHTPLGSVHGGVYTTAVERAASVLASAAAAEHGQIAADVPSHANFLRPMPAIRIDVTATAIHQDRTQQLGRVDLTDAGRRLIATGQVRPQNVEPRT